MPHAAAGVVAMLQLTFPGSALQAAVEKSGLLAQHAKQHATPRIVGALLPIGKSLERIHEFVAAVLLGRAVNGMPKHMMIDPRAQGVRGRDR